eukprot:22737-Ditylum_brightwellii.AAC.1
MKKIAAPDLRMDDTKGQREYNKKVRKTLKQHNIRERMEQLSQHMTFPPTKDQVQEFNSIDNTRTEARKQGLINCKKIYVSGIVPHPEIKKVQLEIRLLDNIISRQEGKKSVKWRTV